MQRALAFLAPRAGAAVADVLATVGSLFVMLFAMFFCCATATRRPPRAGAAAAARARTRAADERHARDPVVASVGVGLLVAAIQGTIGGVAHWLLGIEAAALWGVAMAICALIPLLGTALVWVPTALWRSFPVRPVRA